MKNLNTKIFGLLSIAVLIFTNPAIAQNKIQFGVKGGVNISNLYTNQVDDKNTKFGFNGGVFLKVPLTERIAFQPELLYTMKGAELKYDNMFMSGTASFALNYIEVPLIAVINLTKNVNIHGGVYLASLAGVKVKNVSSSPSFDFENELKKDDFETMDYGLLAGVGVDLSKMNFGIRYEYGIKSVGKERSFLGQTFRFPDGRNSTLQVYLGISIF